MNLYVFLSSQHQGKSIILTSMYYIIIHKGKPSYFLEFVVPPQSTDQFSCFFVETAVTFDGVALQAPAELLVLGEVDGAEAGFCTLLELAVEVGPVATGELEVLVVHLRWIMGQVEEIAVAVEFSAFETAEVLHHSTRVV